MMEHTPGPWTIQQSPHHGLFVQVVSPSYRKKFDANHVVCELRSWQRPEPTANARLIATAPELLSELKRMVSLWEKSIGYEEDYMDMADAARDAIAKAEGKGER